MKDNPHSPVQWRDASDNEMHIAIYFHKDSESICFVAFHANDPIPKRQYVHGDIVWTLISVEPSTVQLDGITWDTVTGFTYSNLPTNLSEAEHGDVKFIYE